MKKILALAGSPRKAGNTELLLDKLISEIKDKNLSIEKIRICELKILPCQHCGGCLKTGECVIADDMQKIYPKFKKCDFLILAAPVFFLGLPAQTKALIDRCQCLWVRKNILKKPISRKERKGIFISVGGRNKPDNFDGGKETVKAFFSTLNIKYADDLLLLGIDKKGDIKKIFPKILFSEFLKILR